MIAKRGVCGEERSKRCLPTSVSSPEQSPVSQVQKKTAEIPKGQKREGEAGEDEEFGEKRKR